jgi:hypothetical protein
MLGFIIYMSVMLITSAIDMRWGMTLYWAGGILLNIGVLIGMK